jgi:hypothetical protein
VSWRPETRTAVLVIGAFFLYFAVTSVRGVPNLLSELATGCAGGGAGSDCAGQVPPWFRSLAGVDLVYPLAQVLVVVGAALALAGRRMGRTLIVVALLFIAAAEVTGVSILSASDQLGLDVATAWPAFVTALGALLLAVFVVAVLRD